MQLPLSQPLAQPVFTSDDDLPPVFQLPPSRTSKAALLEQMEAMQAAFLERDNTLRVQLAEALSDNAKLASEQQAIALARLQHTREQLENRHKPRSFSKTVLNR